MLWMISAVHLKGHLSKYLSYTPSHTQSTWGRVQPIRKLQTLLLSPPRPTVDLVCRTKLGQNAQLFKLPNSMHYHSPSVISSVSGGNIPPISTPLLTNASPQHGRPTGNQNTSESHAFPKSKWQWYWQKFKRALFWTFVFVTFTSALEAARSLSNLFFVMDNTLLYWKWEDDFNISEKGGLFSLSLQDLIALLEYAGEDKRVRGMILDFSRSGRARPPSAPLGPAQLQELHAAVLEFKKLKEKQFGAGQCILFGLTDTFESQAAYYIASACEDIRMEPLGQIPRIGVQATVFFFKRLLDQIGINPETYAKGDFKSVLSMFTETALPAPQRQNMASIVDSLNDSMYQDIVAARHKQGDLDFFNALSQRETTLGPLSATQAKASGLIDEVSYKVDFLPIKLETGLKALVFANEHGHESFAIQRMEHYAWSALKDIKSRSLQTPGSKRQDVNIGILHINGGLQRAGVRGQASQRLAESIINAARDSKVDAILLRIDSPGGDVIASDTIYSAIIQARNVYQTPVVASFGNAGASGAYYIACACDKIIANPTTVTGSIGVAFGRPVLEKALDNLGVDVQIVHGNHASPPQSTILKPSSPLEVEITKRQLDEIYDRFVGIVGQGRHLGKREVEALAQGQVWTGVQAVESGLVDQLGGLKEAIQTTKNVVLSKSRLAKKKGVKTFIINDDKAEMFSLKSLKDWVGSLSNASVAGILVSRYLGEEGSVWLGHLFGHVNISEACHPSLTSAQDLQMIEDSVHFYF